MTRRLRALVCVAALGLLSGCGSDHHSDSQTAFSFRVNASPPPAGEALPLQSVLKTNGLNLQASCQSANGSPVFTAGASTTVRGASLGIHYGLQDGETPTQVAHNLYALSSENRPDGILGPIGPHDGAEGTMTFLRPDGGSVAVTFLEITGAPDADCVFGGSALVHSPSS